MNEVGYFSVEDSRIIAEVVSKMRRFGPVSFNRDGRTSTPRGSNYPFKFIAPVGGVPARQGTQAGSAVVEVVFADENGVLTPSGETETVFNFLTVAVCTDGDRYGMAELQGDLLYWVKADDCQDGDSGDPP